MMTRNEFNQIIADFVRHNLSPTKRERDEIASKYHELKEILEGRTFQNGSYARRTSTTPVNDLDVFFVLEGLKYRDLVEAVIKNRNLDASNILEDLAVVLRKAYQGRARIEVQPHSVGIFFGTDDEFSIDVVPALPADYGMFWVPESSHLSIRKRRKIYESSPAFHWIKSDPKGYIRDASEVDLKSSGRFRKDAKFVKKWRQGCKDMDDNFPLKSFHLELIVTTFFKQDGSLGCLEGIELFFTSLPELIEKPHFPDKADQNRFVDEYLHELSAQERQLIMAQRVRAVSIIEKIARAETEAEVLNLVEELLKPGDKVKSVNIITGVVGGATRTSPEVSRPYCRG